MSKRVFDLAITGLTLPLWLPLWLPLRLPPWRDHLMAVYRCAFKCAPCHPLATSCAQRRRVVAPAMAGESA